VSWSRRGFDTISADPDKVLNRLTKKLGPGDVLLLHDGSGARTKRDNSVAVEVLPRLLKIIESEGLRPALLL
jgi:hypothetical protein